MTAALLLALYLSPDQSTMATEQTAAENAPAETPAQSAPAEAPAIQNAKRPATPLPEHIQHALTLRAQEREIAAELSKTNWGERLDVYTRKAIAHWGMRWGIDVAQEIDILGNRIYLNAKFYLRGLAHLVAAGRVDYVDLDHVEDDPRLAAFPKEKQRRLELRIQHGLPDKAVSAVIARIKLKGTPIEFTGAQWCGGRGTNASGKLKDPIGEERPTETAETRALRRCLRLMVSHIPAEAAKRDAALDDAATDLEHIISDASGRAKADLAQVSRLPRPLAGNSSEDPYGIGGPVAESAPQLGSGTAPPSTAPDQPQKVEYQDDSALALD